MTQFNLHATQQLYELCVPANSTYEDKSGAPFFSAVQNLCTQGADLNWVNQEDMSNTAFTLLVYSSYRSSSYQHIDLLSYCLEQGANPNHFNSVGLNALSIMAHGYIVSKYLTLFTKHGADPYTENEQGLNIYGQLAKTVEKDALNPGTVFNNLYYIFTGAPPKSLTQANEAIEIVQSIPAKLDTDTKENLLAVMRENQNKFILQEKFVLEEGTPSIIETLGTHFKI